MAHDDDRGFEPVGVESASDLNGDALGATREKAVEEHYNLRGTRHIGSMIATAVGGLGDVGRRD